MVSDTHSLTSPSSCARGGASGCLHSCTQDAQEACAVAHRQVLEADVVQDDGLGPVHAVGQLCEDAVHILEDRPQQNGLVAVLQQGQLRAPACPSAAVTYPDGGRINAGASRKPPSVPADWQGKVRALEQKAQQRHLDGELQAGSPPQLSRASERHMPAPRRDPHLFLPVLLSSVPERSGGCQSQLCCTTEWTPEGLSRHCMRRIRGTLRDDSRTPGTAAVEVPPRAGCPQFSGQTGSAVAQPVSAGAPGQEPPRPPIRQLHSPSAACQSSPPCRS